MGWQFRLRMPYYRLRSSAWVRDTRQRVGGWWFRYARWFAPTCKECGATMLDGSVCFACVAQELGRKERIKMLAGHGDENLANAAELFAHLIGNPPKD